jgi:DNA-binding MarR family transcriptional regulator
LEEKGYITRALHPTDKRKFLVHPTEKMREVYLELRQASFEWRVLLSEGISEEEFAVFDSVLERMEARALEIIERQDESK